MGSISLTYAVNEFAEVCNIGSINNVVDRNFWATLWRELKFLRYLSVHESFL